MGIATDPQSRTLQDPVREYGVQDKARPRRMRQRVLDLCQDKKAYTMMGPRPNSVASVWGFRESKDFDQPLSNLFGAGLCRDYIESQLWAYQAPYEQL